MDIKIGKPGEKIDPELFNSIALQAAKRIAGEDPKTWLSRSSVGASYRFKLVI